MEVLYYEVMVSVWFSYLLLATHLFDVFMTAFFSFFLGFVSTELFSNMEEEKYSFS